MTRVLIVSILVWLACSPDKRTNTAILNKTECFLERNHIVIEGLKKVDICIFDNIDSLKLGMSLEEFLNSGVKGFFADSSDPSVDSTIKIQCPGDRIFMALKDTILTKGKAHRIVQSLEFFGGNLFAYELILYGNEGQGMDSFKDSLKGRLPCDVLNWINLGDKVELEVKDPYSRKKIVIKNSKDYALSGIPSLRLNYYWGNEFDPYE